MKTFNVVKYVKYEKKNNPMLHFYDAFKNSVEKEVKKIAISYDLKTREHEFLGGEVGEVCQEMTIKINFRRATLQPHRDFEEEVCGNILDTLESNINGLFENQD